MDEQELKNKLTPEEYKVLREKGTEVPFTGKYLKHDAKGTYTCKVCGNELFSSLAKFDSGTGWPSFDNPKNRENVILEEDNSFDTRLNDSVGQVYRTEVKCAKCHSHLGHVFDDGPTESGKRYCINSVCLDLKEGQ